MSRNHPYKNLLSTAYWDRAVSDRNFMSLSYLWDPGGLITEDTPAGTGGSCFAQYVTREFRSRGYRFVDTEPAPDFLDKEDELRYGYGIYSCRYGNIYTVQQLLQLFKEAEGEFENTDPVWEKDNRYYDSSRPGVMPGGLSSRELVLDDRKKHLEKVSEMFRKIKVYIFTMGLTECWTELATGMVFPTAPGVIAGKFDRGSYGFVNFRYDDTLRAFEEFRGRLKAVNPDARIILTVSPVPLIATYNPEHVLVANTHSKSVLRSVAGDMDRKYSDVHYFPSFELINSHAGRGMFYNPDLRTVNENGVRFVMDHFFGKCNTELIDDAVLCDDEEMV